jgi:diguanylate cyclase (GGDEF)-like protein
MAQRVAILSALAFQIATMLLTLVHAASGLGGAALENAIQSNVVAIYFSVSAAIVVLRTFTERRHRALWVAAATAISLYALAMVLWGFWLVHTKNPPFPSISDGLWWSSYALTAAAIIAAGGSQARHGGSVKVWLDGLIASAATAAVAATFVLAPVINSARGAHQAVLEELLYPLADLVVGTLLVGMIGLSGWRLDRRRVILAVAFVLLLAADSCNSIQVAGGALISNSWIQLLYMATFTCLALAAWQPTVLHSRSSGRAEQIRWSTLVLPTCFALTGPVILFYDHFTNVPLGAFLLTMVAMMAATLRLAVALRDVLTLRDMQRVAFTDELTELPNRRMFSAKLRDAVEAAAYGGGSVTTLMLDLDNFKQLNDTLGHDAGDELLRLIGPRLRRALQAQALIARLGGDEFAVLLPPETSPADAEAAARAVLDSFNEPFRVHGLVLRLTPSIGIAAYPRDADGPDTLLKCADVAMYEAKRSRRGFEHYSSDRDEYTRERLELSGELALALERDQLEVMFQPIADTATGRIVAGEALVRWRKSGGKLRPPSEFLEAAEMAGLSRPLTRRVLKLTLAALRDWRLAGHNVDASVNATVADLVDLSFPDEIAALLEAHELPAQALAIEVTERSIVADPARIGAVLERLRALGVKVALDDFGTGYSSLTHLRELPIDLVKIDRSFVSQMCAEPADAAIVYATIELAHRLGLRTVAEGVEDERTWQELQELGAERIQGYALSRPLEPAAFRALLDSSAGHFAESQSLPTPASTVSGGSIE